ncbi:MAG: hypothetical protein AB1553_00095 [Nitrospirota bacterium]
MRDLAILQDRVNLLEQELKTLGDKVSNLERSLEEMDDLRLEMKALKVYLGRVDPDFKVEFPEVLLKVKG